MDLAGLFVASLEAAVALIVIVLCLATAALVVSTRRG